VSTKTRAGGAFLTGEMTGQCLPPVDLIRDNTPPTKSQSCVSMAAGHKTVHLHFTPTFHPC